MILLITPAARAPECAEALQQATSEATHVAATLHQAATQLRTHEYSAVVIDQLFLEVDPAESELVLQHIGMAIPVQVTFAISGIPRVVRELRAALRRRKQEGSIARRGAEQTLRNDLKSTVTALLLSCEMALHVSSLPTAAEAKLRTIHELAIDIRMKLGIAPEAFPS